MAFVPVPNTLEAQARFILDGQQVQTGFAALCADAPTPTDADNFAEMLATVWWPLVRGPLSNGLQYSETYITDLTSDSAPVYTYINFDPGVGNRSELPIANNVAPCVTHRTGLRGRSYRGRSYIPGVAVNYVERSEMLSIGASQLVDAYNTLRTAMLTVNLTFAVISRYHNNAPRATGVATPVTQSLMLDLVVDSQRRRLPNRGR